SIDSGVTTYTVGETLLPGKSIRWEGGMPFNCSAGGGYSYTVTFQYDNLEYNLLNKRFEGIERLTGECSSLA
ncbi:MAG: hypothetical protein V1744_07360, partial [Candidatus Altiarchaeota archaeon]